jgi:predicted alpha/beta-hydrolase family hydrolase
MPGERWLLDEPTGDGDLSGALLVLWHGAGGDIDQRHLQSLAEGVAARGGHAARARFSYRMDGKRAPDRMPKLIESARDTIRMLRDRIDAKHLFLGGRSMGGRVASMLVAEGDRADGLVFLSYPLHPPKQKAKLRDQHLYRIEIPMLFIAGDRDDFADIELLRTVIGRLGDRATLELWPGADHSFRKVDPQAVNEKVLLWLTARMQRASVPADR